MKRLKNNEAIEVLGASFNGVKEILLLATRLKPSLISISLMRRNLSIP